LADFSPALRAARDAVFSRYGAVAHLEVNGATCTVSINSRLSDESMDSLGFVGDLKFTTAAGLTLVLEAASEWLKARGCVRVQGPISRHTWYPFRLMTHGFDAAPLFEGEPEHPPELHALLQNAGFTDVAWYVSTWSNNPEPQIELAGESTELLLSQGYSFRSLNPDRMSEELAAIHSIVCDSFSQPWNYLFHPISFEEFQLVLGPSASELEPALVRMCIGPQGDLAGLVYSTKEAENTMWIKSATVSPAHRGKGLCTALVGDLTKLCVDAGFQRFAHALIRSGGPSDTISAKGRTEVFRRYAVMEKQL